MSGGAGGVEGALVDWVAVDCVAFPQEPQNRDASESAAPHLAQITAEV
jgi:hypothetical protein